MVYTPEVDAWLQLWIFADNCSDGNVYVGAADGSTDGPDLDPRTEGWSVG